MHLQQAGKAVLSHRWLQGVPRCRPRLAKVSPLRCQAQAQDEPCVWCGGGPATESLAEQTNGSAASVPEALQRWSHKSMRALRLHHARRRLESLAWIFSIMQAFLRCLRLRLQHQIQQLGRSGMKRGKVYVPIVPFKLACGASPSFSHSCFLEVLRLTLEAGMTSERSGECGSI